MGQNFYRECYNFAINIIIGAYPKQRESFWHAELLWQKLLHKARNLQNKILIRCSAVQNVCGKLINESYNALL